MNTIYIFLAIIIVLQALCLVFLIKPLLKTKFERLNDKKLYDEAVKVVRATEIVSASFLQRKFSIGYARAAQLMDMLEENGVIGEGKGSAPRKVLRAVMKD